MAGPYESSCLHPTVFISSYVTCRTIVWDTESRQEMLELPRSGGCNFNAAWSPRIPGMFATASFDGKVPPVLVTEHDPARMVL